jgi:glucose 1-dehydrogenase
MPEIIGRFVGRTAVVTGGGAGIGEAVSRRLAAEGANVVILEESSSGAETAHDIGRSGGSAIFVQADVADEAGWDATAVRAREAFGRVDTVVSNAAAYDVAPTHRTSLDSWRRQLDVCLTGPFLAVRTFLGDLREKGGAVVMLSSVHANFGLPGHPAYAAAKGGLGSLTRQLAVEYGPGVRVNCVVPGPILTDAWKRVSHVDRARSVEQTVARRFGRPEEVAAAVAFLASDEAGYITGASLIVDGGWSVTKSSA